ncbi:N-acetylmuramoyl-L-alanine amidase [Streptomyces fuscigenes]|uniref:N-acetylmuramoyl-L-alanine amidase n=1 Tax=Streptomyces fuscigenes TaxID=1528880 RepID=UPI001F3E6162|nr:N-acetylmuramoyl-L-alanine amidase [Streptomyces fuscigenes]MCF3963968.1 N-acetylmuramoyl-L-alanine amidase [Streptomyces fuscigenes]
MKQHRKNRKRRLLIYGVATGVVASAVAGTVALASPGSGTSQAGAGDPGLQAQFTQAAGEFHVPVNVLMAVSYQSSLWDSHDGRPSTTGSYNVMGLTRVTAADVEKPSDRERLEHLDMSGDPAVMKHFDAKRALATDRASVDTTDPRLHTLDQGAELIGEPVGTVQDDSEQSIRAGAALLAKYQHDAKGSLSTDPGQWYAAVARYSQSPDSKGAALFAQRVFDTVKSGQSTVTADGQQVTLPADPSVVPAPPARQQLATPASLTSAPAPECPSGLACDFQPAAYKQNSSTPDDFGNYNVASRPSGSEDIRYIVIHDTESSYASALSEFQNPAAYASTHYLIRASDGHVTQMVATKDESWHAANKTMNMHSIGIEHEGYAIKSGSWYTPSEYQSSATLVKYLAARFHIPLDREHIIGHDEVPGVLDANVATQHWDPGPFWDWNHYMSLLGAPTGDQGAGGPLKAGQVVRVVPPFTTANEPTLTYGGSTVAKQPANFGYLYTSPSTTSALLTDPYMPTVKSTDGPNWGDKVVAGGEYVVAEAQSNWTAVWYGGKKAWFSNPGGQYTAPVAKTGTPVLKAKAGAASIPVYGRAYPDSASYTGTGVPVQDQNTASLTKYSIPSGQAYVQAGPAQPGDYWYAGTFAGTAAHDRTLVTGTSTFYPIRYNHRIAWVRSSDVQLATGTVPDAGTDRYDAVVRDTSGVLWQYQGTGSATAPFYKRYPVGPGWQQFDVVAPLSALRADGTGDMVARDKTGTLWYYRGSGNRNKPFLAKLKVGTGWNQFNGIWGARDLTGDGRPDLVARNTAGVLYLYQGTGNSASPFLAKKVIGSGWGKYQIMASTGDLTGDGKPDFVARDSAGVLWLYKGTGKATAPFAARTEIGTGWGKYNVLVGPSDLDRDGKGDLLARDTSGVLWLYKATGKATAPFAARVQAGTGWGIFNLVS